jgi:hypothetical protein
MFIQVESQPIEVVGELQQFFELHTGYSSSLWRCHWHYRGDFPDFSEGSVQGSKAFFGYFDFFKGLFDVYVGWFIFHGSMLCRSGLTPGREVQLFPLSRFSRLFEIFRNRPCQFIASAIQFDTPLLPLQTYGTSVDSIWACYVLGGHV